MQVPLWYILGPIIGLLTAGAVAWLGYVSVKRGRREHLLWILPLSVSGMLTNAGALGSFALVGVASAPKIFPIISYLILAGGYLRYFGMFAVLYVAWKSIAAELVE